MVKIIISVVFLLISCLISAQDFQLTWQNCYGGTDDDIARDIISIEDKYFVVGYTNSLDGDISFNHGYSDGWVILHDSLGNLIWEKTYGGSSGDWFRTIIPSINNTYILVGASGSSDGNISNDPYPGSTDYWIVKIDNAGNIIWDRIVGGSYGETIWSGFPTIDGGVVAYGWTDSYDGDVSHFYGGHDTWMIKISNEGEIEWDYTIGTDWVDVCQAAMQTSDGGYLIASNSIILEGGVGNITCTPHTFGWMEGVLFKLDSNLNLEWQHCYGGSADDGITALLEVSDGYVFGAYVNSNDGDISGWHGESDIWVVKIDFDGNIIWQNALGGSWSENTANLSLTALNEIIFFGFTQSNNGDVSGNHSISEFDTDIWFVKLSSEGELLYQQCIGGTGREELYFGVVKKSDNNFVIAGQSDYGPSYDVGCTPHGGYGDEDFWVFEIDLDDTTGIFDTPATQSNVKVYPNPAGEYVVFEFEVSGSGFSVPGSGSGIHSKNNEIQIMNVYGQELATKQVTSEKTVFDLRQWQEGIYFYSLKMEGKRYGGKIVVQK